MRPREIGLTPLESARRVCGRHGLTKVPNMILHRGTRAGVAAVCSELADMGWEVKRGGDSPLLFNYPTYACVIYDREHPEWEGLLPAVSLFHC